MVVTSKNRPIQDVARPQVDEPKVQRALEAFATTISALVRFVQPFVRPEDWKGLAFSSDWADFSDTTQLGTYRKDPMGRVWVRGDIYSIGGAPSAGDLIATLPVGYRPLANSSHLIWTDTGAIGEVEVTSEGLINYLSGTVAHVSLNFSFDTVG